MNVIKKNIDSMTRQLASLILFLLFLCVTVVVGSSNEHYTSIHALDKFGDMPQLRNARESARRYGRTILVASSPNNDENEIMVISFASKPYQTMIHPISLLNNVKNDNDNNNNALDDRIALVCSGIKADARWLIQQVRRYAANVWNRYDTVLSDIGVVAHVVSRFKTRFAIPEDEKQNPEWRPGVRRGNSQEQDWARPLGIQTLVVSASSSSSFIDPIVTIEPSGRVLRPLTLSPAADDDDDAATPNTKSNYYLSFAVLGKNCDLILEELKRSSFFEDDIKTNTTEQLQSKLVEILVSEVCGFSQSDDDAITEILVEVMSRTGIRRKILKVKQSKIISSNLIDILPRNLL